MPYPSTLTAFTDPNASDRLNSPSHSSIESAQNTGLEEIQAFVGTLSSTAGTLIYNIRAAASDGGGHVQTANRGGTGQTAYSQGDILVATSASALTRLAVGVDNQTLQANSSVASGINWVASPSAKLYVNNVTTNLTSAIGVATNVISTSILGSTLGTNNAVRATIFIHPWRADTNATSVVAVFRYAGNPVASVSLITTGAGSIFGTIRHTMIASTVSVQKHILETELMGSNDGGSNSRGQISFNPQNMFSTTSVATVIRGQVFSTSSVESSATRDYEATMEIKQGNGTSISVLGAIVEKFVP